MDNEGSHGRVLLRPRLDHSPGRRGRKPRRAAAPASTATPDARPDAVDDVFVERGVSGSKPLGDRPQGAALLAVLKPGDVVITPKLDRMFRSALDALDVLGQLKAPGLSLHMIDLGGDVTGNGVSKLVFTILSAVAEAERDRTRERIAEVKRDQRRAGATWAAAAVRLADHRRRIA